MMAAVITQSMFDEVKVTKAYYDRGGIKCVNSEGIWPIEEFVTLQDVVESVIDSMYTGATYLNVKNEDDLKTMIGMGIEDFTEHSKKFIGGLDGR